MNRVGKCTRTHNRTNSVCGLPPLSRLWQNHTLGGKIQIEVLVSLESLKTELSYDVCLKEIG